MERLMTKSIYDFKVKNIKGQEVDLSPFKGKYMLIVNTASDCGFTPQYKGLQDLSKELSSKIEVLGFPCNQFGAQEKGDEKEIAQFCDINYHISFPLFSKVEVNGENAAPLFKHLKKEAPGILGSENIKWNFTKFLVSPEGEVLKRYAPTDTPEKIKKDIESL
jgi:glutathione peroxidase